MGKKEARFILNDRDIRLGVCYYPEHWDKSLWREDLQRMKKVGIGIVRIGEFAWSLIEPEEGVFSFDFFQEFLDLAEEENVKVIFGTPTATPPVWLTERYPEVLNTDIYGHRYYHGARRHYNYNSPKYRGLSVKIVTELASHYGSHPAIIGWQIDNELNCETAEFYSEADTVAFRDFLRKKYHDSVDELNVSWGNVFWNQTVNSFEQVTVPRHTIHATVNPHWMLDFYRFVSDSVCAFANMQAEILRRYLKEGDFITTNGIFSHMDNHRLTAESLDFMTYDSYPNFPYCLDSFSERDALHDRKWSRNLIETRAISEVFGIMEQQSGANGWNTRMEASTPRPGQITLWAMQSIAHGADFVSFFRWRTARFGTEMYWHGILDYSGRDNRRLTEIGQLGGKIEKLQALAGAKYEASVAVLEDYDNLFDDEIDRWHGRLNEVSKKGIFTAMEFTHTPFDYFYLPAADREESVTEAETLAALQKYKIAIYPHPVVMTESRARVLTEFVKAGGTLVVGCRAAYKDKHGHCVGENLPGLLAPLLGVDVPEYGLIAPDIGTVATDHGLAGEVFIDELAATDGAEVVASYTEDIYEDVPTLVKHHFGEGTTYYLGTTFSVENTKAILKLLDASDPLRDLIEAPETVELAVRSNENGRFLFVLNYSKTAADITLKQEATDLFSGKTASGKIELEPYGVRVYRVDSSTL